MMGTDTGMTPADMAAIMKDNDSFGNNGSWIWILLIFAIFGGWGNGFGNNNTSSSVQDNYVLASDFSTLSRQIDSQTSDLVRQTNQIANGLCDGFYNNAQMFANANLNIANGFAQAELTRANNQANIINQMNANNITALQNNNALQNQVANGFCQTRYDDLQNTNLLENAIQSGFCQTNFNNVSNTRDVIDSQNSGTQAILAKLNAMESNAKDDKIASLMADNQALKFLQSQSQQNAYIVNQLKTPNPVPAYIVSSPYNGYYNYGTTVV